MIRILFPCYSRDTLTYVQRSSCFGRAVSICREGSETFRIKAEGMEMVYAVVLDWGDFENRMRGQRFDIISLDNLPSSVMRDPVWGIFCREHMNS